MNRRRYLGIVGCATLFSLSGCLNNPGVNGGLLEVMSAQVPPQAEITDSSNERIMNIEPIQMGLHQAKKHLTAKIEVTDKEFETVAQALTSLPWYSRIENGTDYISGIYIRYEDAVYVVVLTPYCTNSWLWKAHSERGDYGWGGCISQ